MSNLGQGVFDEGIERGRRKVAASMLNDKIDMALISKYTQLSIDDLQELEQDMAQGKAIDAEESEDKESIDRLVQLKLKLLKENYGVELSEGGIEALHKMHELHPQLINAGIEQAKKDIALIMLNDEVELALIAKYTRLSIDKIKPEYLQ